MKISILLSRFPYPLDKGDKLRAYHFIRLLSRNHQISLITLDDTQNASSYLENLKPYCSEIHIYSLSLSRRSGNLVKTLNKKIPAQVAYFYDTAIHDKVRGVIHSFNPDVVFGQLLRVAPYLENLNRKVVLDYMDAFSHIAEKNADFSVGIKRLFWRREFKLMREYEKLTYPKFSITTIISERDKSLLNHPGMHVISNGIDLDFFKPDKNSKKKFDFVFVGNLSYKPNIDCVNYILKEVFPAIQSSMPDASLLIAGKSPSKSLLNLKQKNIVVKPDLVDIREAYNSSSVLLAPIQTGAGIQNKILEAMAMGLPCVASRQVADGFGISNQNILPAGNNTHEICTLAISLLQDKNFYSRVTEQARDFVFENYSWEKSVRRLENILTNA